MPVYFYKAKKNPKEVIEGEIVAANPQEVFSKLDSSGLFPVLVKERKESSRIPQKVALKDLTEFTHQLSTLLNSGLPLASSLQSILSQGRHRKIKALLLDVISQIKEGQDFSATLARFPEVFSGFYTSLIRVGETSGTLPENVSRLAVFLEEERDFKSDILVITAYPALVAVLGTLTVFALLKFIVPRIVGIFEEIGQVLPLPTRILIGISNFISNYWHIGLILIFAAGFLYRNLLKKPKYKLKFDSMKIRLPLLGELTSKIEICRMSRTLSLLLKGGLPMLDCLDILSPTLANLEFRQKTAQIKQDVKEGVSLHEAMLRSGMFDETFLNVVSVGEESGRLSEVLEKLSYDYQREVNRNTKILITLLEPLLIIVMGFVIGLIVISMLLPIFQIEFNI